MASLAVTVALGACGEGGPGASASDAGEVRDSAGVRIVTGPADDREAGMVEVFRMGVLDGDPDRQFHRIRSLSLDGTGGMWIVDQHESVRHYDSSGALVGAVGGVGSGPGESARGWGEALARDDGVLLYGYEPPQLALFTTDGTYVESRLPYASVEPPTQIDVLGPVGDEWAVLLETYLMEAEGTFRQPRAFAVEPLTTESFDTLRVVQGRLRRAMPGNHVGRGSWFEGDPAFAADGEGSLYATSPRDYGIDVYDRSGRHVRAIRRSVPAVPYDPAWEDEVGDAVRTSVRAINPSGVAVESSVTRVSSNVLPDAPPATIPALGELLVSAGGTVWVERADRHPRPVMRAVAHAYGYITTAWIDAWRAPRVFDVFDPEGRYRATVTLPFEFVPLAATDERLYGVTTDDLDVEYVVAFEIQEAG